MVRVSFLLLALFGALFVPAHAAGASYEVVACASAPGQANHSWESTANQAAYVTVTAVCPGSGASFGLAALDNMNAPGFAPEGTRAEWKFQAPSGTSIEAIRYSRYLGKSGDNDWRVFLASGDGAVLDSCEIAISDLGCTVGQDGYTANSEVAVGNLSADSLALGFICSPTGGASTCAVGATVHRVWAKLYSATVTLSDATAPTLSNLGGTLLTDTFAHGTQPLTFSASDNAGIRSARVYVDGSVVSSTTYGCDFTYTVPCQNRDQAQLGLDTRSLTDGPHRVQVAAVDPAGNETRSASRDVVVDNSAPRAPADLSVDGGVDWRSINLFDVRWTHADDPGAPVAAAHYQLCAVDGSGCQPPQVQTGDGVSHITGISVPAQGEWALRLWLEDAAGNTDADQSAEVSLRYGIAPSDSAPAPLPPAAPVSADRESAPALDAPISAPSLDPTPTTQPSKTTTRLDPRLRLSRPKPSGRRILIRGVLARSARGRVSLTIRPQHGRLIRRSVTIPSGRFSVAIPRTTLRLVVVRYAGNSAFRPARATLSLSR